MLQVNLAHILTNVTKAGKKFIIEKFYTIKFGVAHFKR